MHLGPSWAQDACNEWVLDSCFPYNARRFMIFGAVDHMDAPTSWSEARTLACNISGERAILPTDVGGLVVFVWVPSWSQDACIE